MAKVMSAPISVPLGTRHHHHHHHHYHNPQQFSAMTVSAAAYIRRPSQLLQQHHQLIQQHQQQQQQQQQQPTPARRPGLFPLNPSLEDELSRLFTNFVEGCSSHTPKTDEIWEDFRHNGKDFEYCPDESITPSPPNKKKNKKPLPTECVFCKNNGEDVKIYKTHLLKDGDGKILCPILRNYTCPICGANGDRAHTLKYCPINKQGPQTLASMNTLKTLRNSTGRRRSK